MANLRGSSKDTVGRFEADGRCKKHPKHRQSPGICSLCLRKKLTQISSSSRKAAISAASYVSSTSSLSSCSSSSSCASPVHRFRFATVGKSSSSSMSIFLLSDKPGLAKSHSLAVFPRRKHHAAARGSGDNNNIKSGKKGGFWSKFLHPKGKRKEENAKLIMHSRSVKEKMTMAS
ncbi:hypothetical protein L6164_016052 [Bauhinia variegata]|uniref:Uncharacterized protein n=1 Tax=Bauhinia variegata TaxID=167791 RepID=A0ACB9NPI7_BAUVA|nr:hypothetical protein L6164_016052 [Bauhinia variegata]